MPQTSCPRGSSSFSTNNSPTRFALSISVLVGNKCDLVDQRKVQYDEARQLAEQWKCPFLETSAKDKVNNEEIFLTVSRYNRLVFSPRSLAHTCCVVCGGKTAGPRDHCAGGATRRGRRQAQEAHQPAVLQDALSARLALSPVLRAGANDQAAKRHGCLFLFCSRSRAVAPFQL